MEREPAVIRKARLPFGGVRGIGWGSIYINCKNGYSGQGEVERKIAQARLGLYLHFSMKG